MNRSVWATVAWSVVAAAGMTGSGAAAVLTLDTFNSGSQSLLLTSTSGTTALSVSGTAATLSGDREIRVATASALSSGQNVQAEVSPSAGAYNTLVTGAAPLTDLDIFWGTSTWATSGAYDLETAIGSSAYQGYAIQVDYSNLQFPAGARTIVFEILTTGGGSALYQALVPPSPTSGTALLSYVSQIGTPNLAEVAAMSMTVQVPAGTGTATSFQFNEVRLVPEPATLVLAGIGVVWIGTRLRRGRRTESSPA